MEGHAMHIDQVGSEEPAALAEGMLKTLVDFFMLVRTDVKVIYRSNFGETAAVFAFSSVYVTRCNAGTPPVSDFSRWYYVDRPLFPDNRSYASVLDAPRAQYKFD
jgi:hypothetical protein